MDAAEKKIIQEEKAIEQEEKKIEAEEKVVINTLEGRQFKTLLESSTVLRDFAKTRRGFIRKIARHKFIFTLIVSTGIILVWRGIWEYSATLPFLSSSLAALFVGVGILWLIERYTDLN